jgi:hypothetical protein
MMTVSSDSRNTTRKTGTENTSTVMLAMVLLWPGRAYWTKQSGRARRCADEEAATAIRRDWPKQIDLRRRQNSTSVQVQRRWRDKGAGI